MTMIICFAFVTLKIFQIDFQLHNYERILDSTCEPNN